MSAYDLLVDGFPHGTPEGYRLGCRSNGGCPGKEQGLTCSKANMRYQGDFQYRRRVDSGLSPAEIVALEVEDSAAAKLARKPAKPVVGKQPKKAVRERAARRPAASAAPVVRMPVEASPRVLADWEVARDAKHAGVLAARGVLRVAARELAAAQVVLQGAVRSFVEAERALEVVEAVEVPRKPRAQKPSRAPKSERVPKLRKVLPHGTNAAYLRCRAAGAACEPCVEAHREYHRNYVAGRRLAGVPAEAHGTAYGYQLVGRDG